MFGFFKTSPLPPETAILMVIVLASLVIAQIVAHFLRRQPESTWNPAVVRAFTHRLRAYWMMSAILTASILLPPIATVVLFFFVSFWALREFITLTPTRMGDHRALFWVFFIFAPLQYFFVYQLQVGVGKYVNWFEVFFIGVPVFGFLFIPARIAVAGDSKRFLERAAKTQAALLICVYALSYAPALLYLPLKTTVTPNRPNEVSEVTNSETSNPGEVANSDDATNSVGATNTGSVKKASPADANAPSAQGSRKKVPWNGNAGVLFFFVVLVQTGDLFQYAWGNYIGKHVIAPDINANRTWEGFIGGVLSTAMLGTLLYWATPFGPGLAAIMSTVIAIMGFAGTMTMSAIKRDRGVKDYGTLVRGHVGVLDRIDSLCFAAPVFFHLARVFCT